MAIIHTEVNPWQLHYGYGKSVDDAINVVAPNTPEMFDWQFGKKSYAIWAWKANYPAFGDGGEVEFFSQDKPLADIGPLWDAHPNDPQLPKLMESVSIGGDVIASDASRLRKTWAASYNPNAQDMTVTDLQFSATITFRCGGMYKAFVDSPSVLGQPGLITPDPDNLSVKLNF